MGKIVKNIDTQQQISLNDGNQLVISKYYYLEISDSQNNKTMNRFEVISETSTTDFNLIRVIKGPQDNQNISLGMKNISFNLD